MTELRQINKQEFLQELKYRVEKGDIYWVKFGKTVGTEIREDYLSVIIW